MPRRKTMYLFIKIRDEQHSAITQKRLFELGYYWKTRKDGKNKVVRDVNYIYMPLKDERWLTMSGTHWTLFTWREDPCRYKEIKEKDLYKGDWKYIPTKIKKYSDPLNLL